MGNYYIGIDIGGTSIKLGLFDAFGRLDDKWRITTDTTEQGKNIISNTIDAIFHQLKKLELDITDIQAIGIGVPGIVTEYGLVKTAVNLGWTDMELTKEFGKRIKARVKVANDANTAALGEMWQGSGKGTKNLVMLTLGTGIGGGVVVDERIVVGAFGAAGEFGHIPIITGETDRCGCGRIGCLEQAASATGIIKEAKRLLERNELSSILMGRSNLSAQAVVEAAKAGDALAIQVMERAGRYLGRALAMITGVLDPEVYIIGGGVSKAGQFLIDIIQKYYREQVLFTSKETNIRLAALGNDAGIYGAARMVL